MAHILLSTFIAIVTVTMVMGLDCSERCYPGMRCWPENQAFFELQWSLGKNTKVFYAETEGYSNITIMINTRTTKSPFLVVMAMTVDDVVAAVKFANKHNFRITVRSSGHDYIGRSTGDGTIQINLSAMKGLKFDLNSTLNPAGVVAAESGNQWLRVYTEASKLGRVIVGGSAHTVSMGGYTLGGGHAPIGRKFGLAVDNLLEVEMVTAEGNVVYANANETRTLDTSTGLIHSSSNTDLFWALRGGGGSTFGIVTEFTYKLHMDSKMVTMLCFSPWIDDKGIDIGTPFLKEIETLLTTTLAPEWGGYHILGTTPSPNYPNTVGSILLSMNHFGEWGSPSFNTILPFKPLSTNCLLRNVSNFLEYEKGAQDPLYFATYIFNRFMQHDSFNDNFYNGIKRMMFNENITIPVSAGGCTGTLIGGNMNNVPSDNTAVSPYFRGGVMSLTCGITWDYANGDAPFIALGEQFTREFSAFGQGTYFNEPSAYLPNWKYDYWGGHYDRLAAIKQVWDPTNVFTCHHCVGSDLPNGFNYVDRASATTGAPSGSNHGPAIIG